MGPIPMGLLPGESVYFELEVLYCHLLEGSEYCEDEKVGPTNTVIIQ